MSEYPILFSGEMVRAILAGTKTQTRRVIEHQPEFGAYVSLEGFDRICLVHEDWAGNGVGLQAFPYARKIGDRLWVRELLHISMQGLWLYRSDNEPVECRTDEEIPIMHNWIRRKSEKDISFCPPIHMPRWASRILLEVAGVRAERLQAISEEDARAEGVTPSIVGSDLDGLAYRAGFATLWDSINGSRPTLPKNVNSQRCERVQRRLDIHPAKDWESNPWVWVVEFKRVAS